MWKKIVFTAMLLFSTFAAASDQEDVQNAYHAWCTAMATAKGNAEVMTKFYAPQAILLPTLSPDMLISGEKKFSDYFANLTRYPEIKCTEQTLTTIMNQNTPVNVGFYTFSFNDPQGKPQSVPSRFTFVYQKQNGQWMIVHHHSSKLP